MAISGERLGLVARFGSYTPQSTVGQRIPMFKVQCRGCGFEPEGVFVPHGVCPKCHCDSWERFPIPRSILNNAQREVVSEVETVDRFGVGL